jgi:hypothetical protein
LLHRLHHRPICSLPAAMACLKELRGRSIGSFSVSPVVAGAA